MRILLFLILFGLALGLGLEDESSKCDYYDDGKPCNCPHAASEHIQEFIVIDERDAPNYQDELDNDFTSEPTSTTEETSTCEEVYTQPPPIQCDMYGFFPDNDNKSLFFFCDLSTGKEEFIVRHMQCNRGRIFDPNYRECILKGTTRDTRELEQDEDEADHHVIVDLDHSAAHSDRDFNCTNKFPGKYPNTKNCHLYYLCLPPELYAPFEKLTVQCPKRTAYDPDTKSCTKNAISRCYQRRKLSVDSNVNCRNQMRFRERKNCDHYYICYHDQVMRIECPQNHGFNDLFQHCMPSHFFECD